MQHLLLHLAVIIPNAPATTAIPANIRVMAIAIVPTEVPTYPRNAKAFFKSPPKMKSIIPGIYIKH